jgi:cephalosporin hydroxylase
MPHIAACAIWVVGAAVLVVRARSLSRRSKNKSLPYSHEARESCRGRRSRFRDSATADTFCTKTVSEHKTVLSRLLREDDVVVEIGCQLNAVTIMMSERSSAVIGVDIDRKPPSTARMKNDAFYRQRTATDAGMPNVTLTVMDVWDLPALADLCHARSVSVIAVDANIVLGNDLPFETLALVRTLGRLLSPRAFVVKSRALAELQHQLRPAHAPKRPPVFSARRSGSGRPPRVHLVAADLVHDYRMAALEQLERLEPSECVLEIGAHVGATTALIHKELASRGRGGCCVGIDVSDSIINRAKKLNPGVGFAVADAWDPASLISSMERCGARPPALILVDVGGLSGATGTTDALALIRSLSAVFQSSLKGLVIKSSCMRTLAMSLKAPHELDPLQCAQGPPAHPPASH